MISPLGFLSATGQTRPETQPVSPLEEVTTDQPSGRTFMDLLDEFAGRNSTANPKEEQVPEPLQAISLAEEEPQGLDERAGVLVHQGEIHAALTPIDPLESNPEVQEHPKTLAPVPRSTPGIPLREKSPASIQRASNFRAAGAALQGSVPVQGGVSLPLRDVWPPEPAEKAPPRATPLTTRATLSANQARAPMGIPNVPPLETDRAAQLAGVGYERGLSLGKLAQSQEILAENSDANVKIDRVHPEQGTQTEWQRIPAAKVEHSVGKRASLAVWASRLSAGDVVSGSDLTGFSRVGVSAEKKGETGVFLGGADRAEAFGIAQLHRANQGSGSVLGEPGGAVQGFEADMGDLHKSLEPTPEKELVLHKNHQGFEAFAETVDDMGDVGNTVAGHKRSTSVRMASETVREAVRMQQNKASGTSSAKIELKIGQETVTIHVRTRGDRVEVEVQGLSPAEMVQFRQELGPQLARQELALGSFLAERPESEFVVGQGNQDSMEDGGEGHQDHRRSGDTGLEQEDEPLREQPGEGSVSTGRTLAQRHATGRAKHIARYGLSLHA